MIRILQVVFLVVLNACSFVQAEKSGIDKIKGMNYSGPGGGPFGEEPFISMRSIGTNYVALIPEASIYQNNLKTVHKYSGEQTWYGETTEAVLEGIMQARKVGLKVMIKPHIYPGIDYSEWEAPEVDFSDSLSRINYLQSREEFLSGIDLQVREIVKWRGDLMAKDDKAWQIMWSGYRKFILSYAVLADSLDVEMLCVGTELKAMVLEQPEAWKELIREVRTIYDGKLTYAANWDTYNKITFWDDLDYIGIDAYFPLGNHQVPTVEQTITDWKPYKAQIKEYQKRVSKPIIFTEWGYETEEYAGKNPWESNGKFNAQVQENLYEGTLLTFWNEPWFGGVFVWRWSPPDEFKTGTYNYSPKEQPAQEVLRRWFN